MGTIERTMLAAVAYRGEQRFHLEQVPVPEIGENDVLVKVTAVSITRGLLAMWFFTDLIRLLPGVIGHEFAGVIVKTGRSVAVFREGDRVRVHSTLTCGNCDQCRTDHESLCSSQCTIGYALNGDGAMPLYERYHNGGMAQYVKVPAANLEAIPDNVTDEVAAKVGTLAGALRALRMTEAQFGDTLVITASGGGAGASVARCARLFGFTTICGVSRNRGGLERLRGPDGLTHSIATSELPSHWESEKLLSSAIREVSGAEGVDAVIDYMPSGTAVTLQAIHTMKGGGRAILCGGNVVELNLSYLAVMRNQYQLKGMRGAMRRDEREIMKLLAAGYLNVSDLVTHVFPLTEVNHALETVIGREEHPVFVMMKPWS